MKRTAIAILLVLPLAGCASSTPGLSLADTKSQVQLLRNGAADRVPSDVIAGVENSADYSSECGEGEPNRQWNSSVILQLAPGTDARATYAALLSSFVEEDWVSSHPGENYTSLVSSKRFSSILVTVEDAAAAPSLLLEVTGPCVETAGADSDEVRMLEQR